MMNAFKFSLALSLIFLLIRCSEEPDEQPLVEKSLRIEFDMEGRVDQYLVRENRPGQNANTKAIRSRKIPRGFGAGPRDICERGIL